ncbi:MAG: hypothetical protein ABW137_09095 [Mycobacterium sp.]
MNRIELPSTPEEVKLPLAVIAGIIVTTTALVIACLKPPLTSTPVATDMNIGATVTKTATPRAPEVSMARPSITGPAPLPLEMQGLPG